MKLTVNEGTTFLVTDELGDVAPAGQEGLYHEDTRFLSLARLRLDGAVPIVLSGRAADHYELVHYLTNPELPGAPRGTLVLTRRRLVGDGMHEDLDITNYGATDAQVLLELRYDADFAHIFEVKRQIEARSGGRTGLGRYLVRAVRDDRSIVFIRGGAATARRTMISFSVPPALDGATAQFVVQIPPHDSWHLCLNCQALDGATDRPPRYSCASPGPSAAERHLHERQAVAYTAASPTVESDSRVLERAYERAVRDFAALRITGKQLSDGEVVIAAGIPWFLAIFGRDSLIAAYQGLPFQPECAIDTLRALARYQGVRVDPETDEQPGKILHEQRFGPRIAPRLIPRFPYYGTVDATPLFLVLLSEMYRWTGDRALVEELRESALRALEWIDTYGDEDGDGYVEYERRAPGGLVNQGWKDHWDSVQFRDGTLAAGPIALCEVQGYVYDAKRRMAELLDQFGEPERADTLRRQAAELKARFNRDFWLEERGYYAMALDGAKRPVDSLTSNPGHLLWSGIADADKAWLVAERLLSPTLFSGWGVRTMGLAEGGYNPISYHNGSVWPHDNALIAAGLARYGFRQQAEEVIGTMLDAAGCFPDFRLPELFAGFDRADTEFPVEYPTSSRPQAWAAGAVMLFIGTMLGLEVNAELGRVAARPLLPLGINRLLVRGLHVGRTSLGLELRRTGGGIELHVLNNAGNLSVSA